jgi:two-component system phosphate regulon response regulator PhoB
MLPCGNVELDLEGRVADVRGDRVLLTFGELEILRTLIGDPGRAFTRAELRIGAGTASDRTVDVHILQLRKKLGAARTSRIETVPSVGYGSWGRDTALDERVRFPEVEVRPMRCHRRRLVTE